MKIYIASSWKNRHAVELLTRVLRADRHNVLSFVEHNRQVKVGPEMEIDQWVNTPQAQPCFDFDVAGAWRSDLVIYIGPSGTDAWAEIGIAYGRNVPVIGLWSKGEQSGLMRKLVRHWFFTVDALLDYVNSPSYPALISKKDPALSS